MKLMGTKICLRRRFQDRMRRISLTLQTLLSEIKESLVLTNELQFDDRRENKQSG